MDAALRVTRVRRRDRLSQLPRLRARRSSLRLGLGTFASPSGAIVVIDADGTTSRVPTRPLAFANGIAIDDTTLWVIESAAPCVSAMALEGGELERVIDLGTLRSGRVGLRRRRRTVDLVLPAEPTVALDRRTRSGVDLRRVDRRADPLAHQRRLLRGGPRPTRARVALRSRRRDGRTRAPGVAGSSSRTERHD